MNRFSRFLQQWLQPGASIALLVEHLDALEALVIRVYKSREATAADEAEYGKLRPWLEANYPTWREALEPHWRQSLVAGQPAQEDPVWRVLQAKAARDFIEDWGAMQHLPAIREALNRLIIAESGEE